jgi:hypothetical protein
VAQGQAPSGVEKSVEIVDLETSISTCQNLPDLPVQSYGTFGTIKNYLNKVK